MHTRISWCKIFHSFKVPNWVHKMNEENISRSSCWSCLCILLLLSSFIIVLIISQLKRKPLSLVGVVWHCVYVRGWLLSLKCLIIMQYVAVISWLCIPSHLTSKMSKESWPNNILICDPLLFAYWPFVCSWL